MFIHYYKSINLPTRRFFGIETSEDIKNLILWSTKEEYIKSAGFKVDVSNKFDSDFRNRIKVQVIFGELLHLIYLGEK
jgi:hypothetical protein